MGDRVQRITEKTVVPLAIVVAIAGVVWGVATDRARALGMIETHERRIENIETKLDAMAEGIRRIEIHLGTQPAKP